MILFAVPLTVNRLFICVFLLCDILHLKHSFFLPFYSWIHHGECIHINVILIYIVKVCQIWTLETQNLKHYLRLLTLVK